MPVYLLHGFRWPRPLIRIHIILQNLEDAAAEWLVAPNTTAALIDNFEELFPDSMNHLPNLRFIEQHDPEDLSPAAGSQPYAYVADVVQEVKLGLDVDEVRGRGVTNEQWASLLEIRDKIAPEANVGWYVVVCGDEERWAPDLDESSTEEEVEVEFAQATPMARIAQMPKVAPVIPPIPKVPIANGTPLRNESIGYPTKTETVRPQTRNGSAFHHERNDSYDSTRYNGAVQRPKTAGSTFTSVSSRTTKGTSSPEISRRDHSSPELSRTGSGSSPETQQRGFKRILSSLKRRKSRSSFKDIVPPRSISQSSYDAPPVPSLPRGTT